MYYQYKDEAIELERRLEAASGRARGLRRKESVKGTRTPILAPTRVVMVAMVLAAPLVVVQPLKPVAVRAAAPLTFATATVVDPVNLYGEPDLRQDPSAANYWYASGPWGTGTQRSIWNQSQDGTHTFRELHDLPDPLQAGGSLHGPGGGDTEIAADHTGKFYGADLGALVTQHTTISTDRGKTFTTQPLPDAFKDPQLQGTDRQWFGLWDPPNPAAVQSAYHGPFPVNYMIYLAGIGGTCSSNCEIGTSSVPTTSGDSSQVGLNYGCAPGATGTAACPLWNLNDDGFVFLDQLTGKVVQAIEDPSGNAAVEVLTPGANGYLAQGPGTGAPQQNLVATLTNSGTNTLFPAIAEDAQRNAYYVWVERPSSSTTPRLSTSWQVFYSWSPAGPNNDWSQWSAPIQVSSAPSNTAIMPWAIAGGNGNLDIAWYGTANTPLNPESDGDSQTASASWFVYMAQVQNANSTSPIINQVRPVDHPMHHGSICLSGLNCITITGNRNLADFFEITADQNGAAYIVFNNTANDLIQQAPIIEADAPAGVIDHTGAEVVMVVRQISGPGLNGVDVPTEPTDYGVNSITSNHGDALYPAVNGPNFPGLDLWGTSIVAKDANTLEATVTIDDPSQIVAASTSIGEAFVDVVVRWEYKSKLYFAEAELPAAGQPAVFYDGLSQSIDLCSVSACDPHILTYPGPGVAPLTSHLLTTGTVTPRSGSTPGSIVIDIPRADVGGPIDGDHLDSVGAYSLVSLYSANVGPTNAQAQNDQVAVEVDGACCFTPMLGSVILPDAPLSSALLIAGGAGAMGSAMFLSRRRRAARR